MKHLQVAFFILICLHCTAQKEIYQPEEIRRDMAILKHKFEKLHPGMYYYQSKEDYNRLYDSLYNSLTSPLGYLDAYKILNQLVTAVEDGHTNLRFDKKRFDAKKIRYIPFYIRKIENKYYISLNTSQDSTIVRGSEVLSINGEPIEVLMAQLKTYVSADKNNPQTKEYYSAGYFPNYYLRKYGEKDSVKISYRLPLDTTIRSRKLACLPTREMNKFSEKRYKAFKRPNFGLKVIDSLNHIAMLDITQFTMKGKLLDFDNRKFKRVLKDRFKKIKAQGVEHLIIDFRGNGGGYIPNIYRVLKYLAPEPFTIIDSIGFKKTAYFTIAKPWYIGPPLLFRFIFSKREGDMLYRVNKRNDNQKPESSLVYTGKTYFLTDPGCYSATTFTLNVARDMGVGQTIGQPVGGASWGSFAGTWENIRLPNTRFVVHTPLYRIVHKLPKKVNQGFFLDMDYEVNRNYEELIKNNTSAVDFITGMIIQSKEAQQR